MNTTVADGNDSTAGDDDIGGYPLWHPVVGVDQFILISFASLITLSSVVLNAIVLATLARTKSLRRLQNLLVASLAVADLMRAAVVVPFYIALLAGSSWFLPDDSTGCTVFHVFSMTTESAVVYMAALVGVERAFLISRPLTYQRVVTPRRLTVVVVITWAACALFGGLRILGYDNAPNLSATLNHSAASGSPAVTLDTSSAICFYTTSIVQASLDAVFGLLVPLVTLVVSYSVIFCIVRSQMRRIAPPRTGLSTTVGTGGDDARGGSTWMTSASGSRGSGSGSGSGLQTGAIASIDSEATSDDRSTTAVTTGHQRRNSVTSRLHSTPSLSSLSRGACDIVAQAPGRVLNGIAEDESHDCSCCDEHDADVSSRDIAGGNWPRAAAITASPDVSVTPPTTDPVANCAPKTCSMGADMGTRRGSGIYDELPVLAALRSTMTARRNAVVTSDIGSYPIEVADDDQSQTATVTTAVARRRSSVSFYIPTETTTSGDEIDPLQVPKITHSCSSAEVETKTAASTVPSHVNRPLRVAAGPSPMRSGAPYCQHDNIAVAFRPASAAVPLRSASFSGALPAVRKLSQPSFTSSRLISAGPLPATTVSRPSSSSSSDAECGDGGSLRVTKPSATTAPRPSVSSTVSSTGRRRSLLIRINDNKAVRMTIIVVGAFLACWIPVSVAYLMRVVAADSSSVSNLVWDAVVLVSYAASTIDPLIYNFYSAEFRRAARRVLSCGQHKSGVLIA